MIRGFPEPGVIVGPVGATIGSFDGVHLGHQRLLKDVTAGGAANGVLITFDPHPRCVVDPRGCPPLLTSAAERGALAAEYGAGTTIVLRFDRDLSRLSAEEFCDRMTASLSLERLVIGPGFALGHGRQGDAGFLRDYGAAHGFDLVTTEPVTLNGEPVSSGRIRAAVSGGDVGAAAMLLGRHVRIPGVVVRGDGRGRSLGFPTANLATDEGRCIPARGVYATWFGAGSRWYPAATNVGVRPTFDAGDAVVIEAHLLDVDIDLYGQRVRIDFIERLRDEVAFASADALVQQMREDVEQVRVIMRDRGEPSWVP